MFAVADGMAARRLGEVASQCTVEAIHTAFMQSPDAPFALTAESSGMVADTRGQRRQPSNRKAYAADHGFAGSGTTVVVLAFDRATPTRACVLHAGEDSRAYRFRDGLLSQLTADHSLAAAAGVTVEESLPMRFRGVITRAVGLAPDVELERTSLRRATERPVSALHGRPSKMVSDPQLAALLVREGDRPFRGLCRR